MSAQATFAAALLHPEAPCPPGWRAHNGSDPGARFDVYRNNVVASLVEALADAFPVARELVGDPFFRAMARGFVMQHPPASPVLAEYGHGFAAFVDGFEPAASVPFLGDVARLERARVCAFHARDARPLPQEEIAAQLSNPAALVDARPGLHPSVQVVRSRYAIVSVWAAHQGDAALEHVDPWSPEAALVLRADDDVVVRRVPCATAAFVHRLVEGASLGQSMDAARSAAGDADDAFDLVASLAILVQHRAFIAWSASP